MAKKAKKGEGARSETLTVRLTPRMKYGLELQARKQHRTLAGVVEWAIERGLYHETDGLLKEMDITNSVSGTVEKAKLNLLEWLWDPSEIKRLCLLCMYAYELMTYEEQKLWSLIAQNAYYWQVLEITSSQNEVVRYIWPSLASKYLIEDRVVKDLDALKDIAYNNKELINTLPIWIPGQQNEKDSRYTLQAEGLEDSKKCLLTIYKPTNEEKMVSFRQESIRLFKEFKSLIGETEPGKRLLREFQKLIRIPESEL
jgi:hypothetical protein